MQGQVGEWVQLHVFLTTTLEGVNAKLHAPALYVLRIANRVPGVHRIRDRVGPRVGVGIVDKTNTSVRAGNQTRIINFQATAFSLQRPQYPGYSPVFRI